jgi:acetyl-CoA carboxylase biotin carboxyl carrier protein
VAKETGLRDISGLLSDDDIRLIGQLANCLDHSTLNFLEMDIQGLQVSLAKADLHNAELAVAVPLASPLPSPKERDAAAEGTIPITARLIGFFHAEAESGPPVTVGTAIDEDAIIGIISLMDLRKPLPAGIRGVITQICVEDGQFVEYGQTLCRVRPV